VRDDVSVPPRADELSDLGRRDWTTGIELIRTCMATHDTKTYVLLPPRVESSSAHQTCRCDRAPPRRGLAPEIAHFRIPSDSLAGLRNVPGDWYIKGAGCGTSGSISLKHVVSLTGTGLCVTASEKPRHTMHDTCSGTSLLVFFFFSLPSSSPTCLPL